MINRNDCKLPALPVSPFHCRIRWASDCPRLRAGSGRSPTIPPLSGKVIFVFYLFQLRVNPIYAYRHFHRSTLLIITTLQQAARDRMRRQSHRVIIAVIISIFLHYPSVGCRLRYWANAGAVVRTRPFIKTMTPFSVSMQNRCLLTQQNNLLHETGIAYGHLIKLNNDILLHLL